MAIYGTAGADELPGTTGNDVIYGNGGNDTITGNYGYDVVFGGTGNDVIDGGYGEDALHGESGADIIFGGDGSYQDYLYGEAGNDILSGEDGSDVLFGGNGGDALLGGTGDDRFVFEYLSDSYVDWSNPANQTYDWIYDFEYGDTIDVQQIDASALLSGGQAFQFLGNTSTIFTGAGELIYNYSTTSAGEPITIIDGFTNGDGYADLTIVLAGTYSLSASDFLL